MYPSIDFSKKLNDTNYIITVGWKTQLINNTYSSLVQTNPWLAMPSNLAITSKDKKFIGVTINANKHLNYGFMLSNNEYHNLPLFNRVANTNNLKYGVIYESLFERKASTIELEAFLTYQFSDKLVANNGLKYTQFNSLQENAKPWGILPVEFKSKMSWLPNSKWVVDGEIQMFTGATVNNTSNLPINLNSGLLLNAGFAYKFTKNWSGWAKGENLLNKPIERWSDYPSLGVQLIAGVVYSFRK
jgi:outer membrane receptor for ferrienterochelin and colicin